MLENDMRKVGSSAGNLLKISSLPLEHDIEAYILLSSPNYNIENMLYGKIVDALFDTLHPKTLYSDFSRSLESINTFLNSYQDPQNEGNQELSAIIGVYLEGVFYFSTIGKASVYMYSSGNDIIEVSDKRDEPSVFSFISSGEIIPGESLILSTHSLLDTLSRDDIKDSFGLSTLTQSGANIESILKGEYTEQNIAFMLLGKQSRESLGPHKSIKEIFQNIFWTCADNVFIKKLLSQFYTFRDMLQEQSKMMKQVFFALACILCSIILYIIIASFLSVTTQTLSIDDAKDDLIAAQNSLISAGESMNNEDMFLYNIDLAVSRINDLESRQLFLADLSKLKQEVKILKKQFNGILSYSPSLEQKLYALPSNGGKTVKILGVSNQIYVVQEDRVIGPIIKDASATIYPFDDLSNSDIFTNAVEHNGDIIISTKQGKMVRFSRNKYFSYIDSVGQDTWDLSQDMASYASNIYLISEDNSNVLRHKKSFQNYGAGAPYLKEEDTKVIGDILSIAVDGGIYLLTSEGAVLKFFRTPEYRLESLSLNKLPSNYDFENLQTGITPNIYARKDLRYVYMFIDNRIYIFRPSTLRYQDTKFLDYIGQIEGGDFVIEQFYVDNDGELFLSGNGSVYRLEFEIDEDSIILK